MAMKFYFQFDEPKKYGSPEHFHHFLWGYLLPLTYKIVSIKENSSESANATYYLRSCGPIMDKIALEVLSLLNVSYQIVPLNELASVQNFQKIKVRRWDVWLSEKRYSRFFQFRKNLKYRILYSEKPLSDEQFLHQVYKVKKYLMEKLNPTPLKNELESFNDKFLILIRSDQPAFYNKGGGARIEGYGKQRRALAGVEEAVEFLNAHDVPTVTFEPGKYSLAEQIYVFFNCSGLLGIRGAEFANLIWIKSDAKVLMIDSDKSMSKTSPAKILANYLNINFTEILSLESKYPVINGEEVYQLIRGSNSKK